MINKTKQNWALSYYPSYVDITAVFIRKVYIKIIKNIIDNCS